MEKEEEREGEGEAEGEEEGEGEGEGEAEGEGEKRGDVRLKLSQAIQVQEDDTLLAVSDSRKEGEPAGY